MLLRLLGYDLPSRCIYLESCPRGYTIIMVGIKRKEVDNKRNYCELHTRAWIPVIMLTRLSLDRRVKSTLVPSLPTARLRMIELFLREELIEEKSSSTISRRDEERE